MEDFKEQITAFGYVMENHIINKYLTRYVDVKKSLQRNERGIAK